MVACQVALYQVVDGLGAKAPGDDSVAGRDGPEDRAGADGGQLASGARPHRAAGRVEPDGQDHKLGLGALLVGLGAGMVTTRPWGRSFTSSKSSATSSERRSAPAKPTSSRGLVPGAGQVGFRGPAESGPCLGPRAGLQDV
jgi:hypothetical protein